MTTAIDETFRQMNVSAAPTPEDLGYETCAPDTDKDAAAKYGYGEESNSNNNPYGYGDTPTAAQLGYGDPDAATQNLGYEDPDAAAQNRDGTRLGENTHSASGAVDYGYGDDGGGSGEFQPDRRRRERPRRRGSVTKYSLDAQDTVQQEFEAHAQAISQYRGGVQAGAPPPPPPVETVPLKGDGNVGTPLPSRSDSAGDMSEDDDNSVDDMSCEDVDAGTPDKKKKKKRFGRFRIGRNRSGMSTGSNTSLGSKNNSKH